MRHTRIWLGTLMVLIALVFSPAVHAAETFTDPEGKFAFTAPDGYETLTSQDIRLAVRAGSNVLGFSASSDAIVVAFRDPLTMASVNVGAAPLGGAVTDVDEGARQLTQLLGSLNSITLDPVGIEATTIGGEPARTYGYTIAVSGLEARGRQFLVIRDDTAYFITFTALSDDYDRFFEQTRIVLDTFTFLP